MPDRRQRPRPGLVAADLDADRSELSVGGEAHVAAAEDRVGAELVPQPRDRGAHLWRTYVPLHSDQCRARTGLREVAVERLVSLLGLESVRQRADAAGTEIKAKSRNRKGDEQRAEGDQVDDGVAHHGPDDAAPEAPFVAAADVPADERHAQRVDAVAEHPEQRGQQRQRS